MFGKKNASALNKLFEELNKIDPKIINEGLADFNNQQSAKTVTRVFASLTWSAFMVYFAYKVGQSDPFKK